MILSRRQQRILKRTDRALRRSDPALAAKLSIFARLNAQDEMPALEQSSTGPDRRWRAVLWTLMRAAAFVAGGRISGPSDSAGQRDSAVMTKDGHPDESH